MCKARGKIFIPRELVTRLVVNNHFSLHQMSLKAELQVLKEYHLESGRLKNLNQVNMITKNCIHFNQYPKLLRKKLDEAFITSVARQIPHLNFFI